MQQLSHFQVHFDEILYPGILWCLLSIDKFLPRLQRPKVARSNGPKAKLMQKQLLPYARSSNFFCPKKFHCNRDSALEPKVHSSEFRGLLGLFSISPSNWCFAHYQLFSVLLVLTHFVRLWVTKEHLAILSFNIFL